MPARAAIALAFGLSLLLTSISRADEPFEIELNDLMDQTQKVSPDPDRLMLVWWIPAEFWPVSMAGDPDITEAQIDEVVRTLEPYVVVAAVDGLFGPFGGVDYKEEAAIRSTMRLRTGSGTVYKPIEKSQVSKDAANLLQMLKPVLAGIIGPMGENMHFYVFPAKGSDGKPLVEPKAKGSFTLAVGGEEMGWRLPLGALLPPHVCPACKEKLSGAFSFCPYDGRALRSKGAAASATNDGAGH